MNQSTLDLALALAVANGADPATAAANLAKIPPPAPVVLPPDTVVGQGVEIRRLDLSDPDSPIHRFDRVFHADGSMTETDAGPA